MEKLINSCIGAMLEYKVIDEQQRTVMEYSLDLLFSSVVSLLSFALLGIIFDVEMQTFILLMTFIPLQSFGGGYHCQTHFKCWMLMMVTYILSIFVLMKLPLIVLWCGAVLGAYPFLKWAPIENPRAPFGEEFGKRMRSIVIAVYFIALLVAAVASWGGSECVEPILTGVIMSGVSILYAKVKQVNR